MGVQETSRGGGRGEEKMISLVEKNFYWGICLVVLTATVVSKYTDGGGQEFRGFVLYCFSGQ